MRDFMVITPLFGFGHSTTDIIRGEHRSFFSIGLVARSHKHPSPNKWVFYREYPKPKQEEEISKDRYVEDSKPWMRPDGLRKMELQRMQERLEREQDNAAIRAAKVSTETGAGGLKGQE